MAVNVSNTTTTNTFEFWRLRTNQMANLFRVKAVTTNSNTTPGSAAISGTFSGGNLKANGSTQSTSITTGSLQTRGGLGVSRNAHIGGKLVVTGVSNTANINVAGTASATLFSGDGSSLTSVDADTVGGFPANTFVVASSNTDITGTFTFSTNVNISSTANIESGFVKLPNTANISIANMGSNSNRYLRVNGTGTGLVFSESSIANTGDIGDVQINYGSISNADVLVWDENTNKFVNRPRSLIDITSIDDIDDVNVTQSRGDLLVRVVNTSNSSTFDGTSNGFITGRLDSMSEFEISGQTSNNIAYTSTSNSFIQVYKNGVKLANADFTVSNTTHISFSNNLVASETINVVEFNPHAFVVGDGTPSELNQLNYSDIRLKTGIENYEASSSVFDIETYSYQWKDTVRFHNRKEIGFIAQDLEKYVPELVTENPDGEKMVDYGKMTAVLLSTIKQLNKRVEALESKVFCKNPEE